MEEKKIKISLGTGICIAVIVILLCVIVGMWLYFNKKLNNKSKAEEKVNTIATEVKNVANEIKNNNIAVNEVENDNLDETDNDEDVKSLPNNIKKNQDDSKNIIMYDGMNIAKKKPGIYTFDYEAKEFPSYYNTTYDMYQNGKKTGETSGKVKGYYSDMWDTTCYSINFEKQDPESTKKYIFVSCNYDVVPREYEKIKDIPDDIKYDFDDRRTSLKVQGVDLDGDGKKEYIVAYSQIVDDITKDYEFGVYVYDSNYKRVSVLAKQNADKEYNYLSSFDNITYMDIDKDGNMEIIISIPVASSYFRFGIYKYEDGAIKGQIDTFGIGG